MQDIEITVATATKGIVESGKLNEMVAKQVEATLAGIVRDSLGEYSAFGKQLKEALNASLAIDTKELGLNAYNQAVLAIVRMKLATRTESDAEAMKRLGAEMDAILGTNAPKEIKLSKLIDDFKEYAREKHHCGCDEPRTCTIIFEEPDATISSKSRWLYLDPESSITESAYGRKKERSKYECQLQMLISEDGSVTVCKIGGHDPKKSLYVGGIYGFERTVFQMYAAGTKVVIDTDDFDGDLYPD